MIEKSSPMERPVKIGICTSALRSNIEAFLTIVASLTNVTVRFIELPYNDLDSFRLSSKGLDGVIICHSINNRRFAITDVMDALYNVFLPHVKRVFGKGSVCVIAHDFMWPMGRAGSSSGDHARIKDTQMDNFRCKQPTTFNCSSLTIICGKLDNQVDMDEEDWTQLEVFVRQCRVGPEISRNITVRRVMSMMMGEEGSRWLEDAIRSLWTSFKQNVIGKTLERYQSYRGSSETVYRMLYTITWFCIYCCWFNFTLVLNVCWGVCKYVVYRRHDDH